MSPLSTQRRMVIASVSASKKSAIHCVTGIDVTVPRQMIRDIHEKGGPKYSFTGYLVKCLAETLKDHPEMNSFIHGKKLVRLDDITISVLVERSFGPEKTPEPLAIRAVQDKSLSEVHGEIRQAQERDHEAFGNLSGSTWVRLIPPFLMNLFVRVADRNITMAKKYGKVAVTAVGMFSRNATWFIPHGTATILLTVGGINTQPVWKETSFVPREMLQLTASFDHHIVDGGPAARFMKEFSEQVESGRLIESGDQGINP